MLLNTACLIAAVTLASASLIGCDRPNERYPSKVVRFPKIEIEEPFDRTFRIHQCRARLRESANTYCLVTNLTDRRISLYDFQANLYDVRGVKIYDFRMAAELDPKGTTEVYFHETEQLRRAVRLSVRYRKM